MSDEIHGADADEVGEEEHDCSEHKAAVWISERRMGGSPCLCGHRLPLDMLHQIERDHGVEDILRSWPYLDREHVEHGLRLYRELILPFHPTDPQDEGEDGREGCGNCPHLRWHHGGDGCCYDWCPCDEFEPVHGADADEPNFTDGTTASVPCQRCGHDLAGHSYNGCNKCDCPHDPLSDLPGPDVDASDADADEVGEREEYEFDVGDKDEWCDGCDYVKDGDSWMRVHSPYCDEHGSEPTDTGSQSDYSRWEIFKTLREVYGCSVREVAKRIGVSASYVSEVENGNVSPSYRYVVKFAGAFDLYRDWLLMRTGHLPSAVVRCRPSVGDVKDAMHALGYRSAPATHADEEDQSE